MALNDSYPFLDGLLRFREVHDFDATDVVKCALITNAFTPAATTAHPCWGAGGTTDLSSYEVTPGGNYSAGGAICANSSITLNGSYIEIDFDNPPAWADDPSNPTDARWAIFYNSTATLKECLGFYDLGSVFDMSAGELVITLGSPFARFQVYP